MAMSLSCAAGSPSQGGIATNIGQCNYNSKGKSDAGCTLLLDHS